MFKLRTLLVLAAIVCGISGLVWVPAQAQTSGVFEAMLVKQEAQPSPTLIPELTPTTTQLTEDNQAVQTSTPELTVGTMQFQDVQATPALVPELSDIAGTKAFLPLVMAKAAPTVTILFSDKKDASGNLVNPRTAFFLIRTLYYQVQVNNAEGKQFQATISLDNSPEYNDKTAVITSSPFTYSNALSGSLFLPSVTVRIRVYLDGVLIQESIATVY